ncbi:MAG: type II toxin-antitoxin system RelE/ParE family toxin [Deltaproteobacteria bacterium]|nr:type II toxin-antitoxin system RelE/ParE family toxin [Deltaproteobacteria bacterium]
MIDAAETLQDLRIPPSNRLEKLSGDRRGQHSLRVNNGRRISSPSSSPLATASRATRRSRGPAIAIARRPPVWYAKTKSGGSVKTSLQPMLAARPPNHPESNPPPRRPRFSLRPGSEGNR